MTEPLLLNSQCNKTLKPTVTRVTPFAKKAKPAPRYGGLIPPLCIGASSDYALFSLLLILSWQ
jgi:hypothetical protein